MATLPASQLRTLNGTHGRQDQARGRRACTVRGHGRRSTTGRPEPAGAAPRARCSAARSAAAVVFVDHRSRARSSRFRAGVDRRDQEGGLADPQGNDADHRRRVRLRGGDGGLSMAQSTRACYGRYDLLLGQEASHEQEMVCRARLLRLREERAARADRPHQPRRHAGQVRPDPGAGRRSRRDEERPEEHFASASSSRATCWSRWK